MLGTGDHKKRNAAYAIAAITLVAIVLRVIHLTRFSFWVDECLTIFVGQMPLKEGVRLILFTDVHPPLYYILLHYWQAVSQNEIFLRSLSLIPGVAAIPVFYLVARRLVSGNAALIASVLLAVCPLHVVQSQQLRYPSLLLLFTLLSVLFFHHILYGGRFRDRIVFVFASLCMLYTNYLSIGVLLLEITWLVWTWKQNLSGRAPAWKSLGVVSALFALWIPIVVLQSQRMPSGTLYPLAKILQYTLLDFTYGIGFWGMPRAGSRDAELAVLGLADHRWLFYTSLLPFLSLLLAGFLPKREGRWWTFEKLYLVIVLGFAWLVCARSNVFQAKYILPALPPFLIVMALGIERVVQKWKPAAAAILAVYLLFTTYGLGVYYTKDMAYQEYYREVAHFLQENKEPGDAVVLFHGIADACVSYYVQDELGDVYVIPKRADDDQMDRERFLDLMREIESDYKRMWVVYYYERHRDPAQFSRQWFPVQFRKVEADLPKQFSGLVELYTVPFGPKEDSLP